MLKIKKDFDLEKLKDYGFEEVDWGYIYYPKGNSPLTRYFSSLKIGTVPNKDGVIQIDLENMPVWCNSLEQLEKDMIQTLTTFQDKGVVVKDDKCLDLN